LIAVADTIQGSALEEELRSSLAIEVQSTDGPDFTDLLQSFEYDAYREILRSYTQGDEILETIRKALRFRS
jgi:hypothetical protein